MQQIRVIITLLTILCSMPVSASLIGLYDFTDGTANNQASGPGALPDLTVNSVTFSGGAALFDSGTDYLALPVPLGATPFTIYVDAAYDPSPLSFSISQQSAANSLSTDADFIVRNFPSPSNQVTFYDAAGTNMSVNNGTIDGGRHRIAITYDGVSLGNFFDGVLLTSVLGGTLPDIDGTEVRFGDRSLGDGIGATGTLYEVRIFDTALSQAALNSIPEPGVLTLLGIGLAGLGLLRRSKKV